MTTAADITRFMSGSLGISVGFGEQNRGARVLHMKRRITVGRPMRWRLRPDSPIQF